MSADPHHRDRLGAPGGVSVSAGREPSQASSGALSLAFRLLRRTPGVARRALIGVRHNDRGEALEPDTALLLALSALRGEATLTGTSPEVARANLVHTIRLVEGPVRPLAEVRELVVAEQLPGRLYVPRGDADRLLVYLHGGGWVVGGLRSHDRLCQRLADEGQQRVLAIDYRLAPEHPFPAAADDALAAVRWARRHAPELGVDPQAIAVGGDSAGGNLAAVVALQLRALGEPQPAFQLLIYPATDLRRVTASHRALAEGYLLTRASLDWYQGHYAPEIYDPRGSPLLVDDHRGLAPAIVASAGFDPLRDDAELYADALRSAGVQVSEHRFPGLVHGFANMDGALPAADRAVGALIGSCRERWRAVG